MAKSGSRKAQETPLTTIVFWEPLGTTRVWTMPINTPNDRFPMSGSPLRKKDVGTTHLGWGAEGVFQWFRGGPKPVGTSGNHGNQSPSEWR